MPGFGQVHLLALLVDPEIALAFLGLLRFSCGTMRLTRMYSSGDSSAGPEMISGVRASSIRIESTSSTMA
jgi:hypothetical protein